MNKIEMIALLVQSIKDGINYSDWRLHETSKDIKCVIDMAESMLEQEDYTKKNTEESEA